MRKQHLFNSAPKLDLLEKTLLETLHSVGWSEQAWAVFPNHYHFVGQSPDDGPGLTGLTQAVHRNSARELNRMDGTAGRAVWYRCWDTRISFAKSYMARLAYVHNNPVKHGLVRLAEDYKCCSASWFATNADRAFYDTIMGFKTDRVTVYDSFEFDGSAVF